MHPDEAAQVSGPRAGHLLKSQWHRGTHPAELACAGRPHSHTLPLSRTSAGVLFTAWAQIGQVAGTGQGGRRRELSTLQERGDALGALPRVVRAPGVPAVSL